MLLSLLLVGDPRRVLKPRIVPAVMRHQGDELDQRDTVAGVKNRGQSSSDELPFSRREQIGRRPDRTDASCSKLGNDGRHLRIRAQEDRDIALTDRTVRQLRRALEKVSGPSAMVRTIRLS